MNNREFAFAIKKVLDSVHQGEKLALPMLAVKASRYAEANPTDASAVTASHVLSKMAESKSFISREDFSKLIGGFHSSQSKLASLFSDEIGVREAPTKLYSRAADEGTSLSSDYEKVADPVLSNALSQIFEPNGVLKIYSEATAKKAQKACLAGLVELSLKPNKVDVFAGQEDLLICAATYQTPKGETRVLVPIEIKEGVALLPSLFISQAGFTELSAKAVYAHIVETAGKPMIVNAERALSILSEVKNGARKVASDVELAIIHMNASKKAQASDPNGIIGLLVDEDNSLKVEAEQSRESIIFAQKLSKADGTARFIHGDRVVEAGRNVLLRKLAQEGYRYAQVKIADYDSTRVVFAVSIANGMAFQVPIKVTANNVEMPKIFIHNGEIKSLSKVDLDEVVKSGATDTRALAMSSQHYHLRADQLLKTVKEACEEGNFAKAEDCVNVLAEIDPTKAKVAIGIVINYIGEPGKRDVVKTASVSEPMPYLMSYKVFYPDGV